MDHKHMHASLSVLIRALLRNLKKKPFVYINYKQSYSNRKVWLYLDLSSTAK